MTSRPVSVESRPLALSSSTHLVPARTATLTYSFVRITAVLTIKGEDLRPKGAGWQRRLHEKGGKHHVMPCHHALVDALRVYIDTAGITEDR